jgi:hypothetical protein
MTWEILNAGNTQPGIGKKRDRDRDGMDARRR